MATGELLCQFMRIPAPSGYEMEMAAALKRALTPLCDTISIDRLGNCIGYIRGTVPEAPRAMVFAHMDQLGFIVRKIDTDGYLQVDRLGGIPEKVLPGLMLSVRDERGRWHPGVFGAKSHHAMSAEEIGRVDSVSSLLVDIGARTDSEVRDMGIEVGCPVIYAPACQRLEGTRVAGTAVDNRGGCAALVDIAQRLRDRRPRCDVYIVGTVWEEFNLRGAMMAARSIKPQIALSLDVVLSGDTRDLEDRYDVRVGAGACVQLYSFHGRGTLNGTLPHEPLYRLVKRASDEACLPLQRFASLGLLTDMAYLQLEGEGVACLELGFPARYTHTPVEVCDMQDVEALAHLVAETLQRVDVDFTLDRFGGKA